MKIFLERINEDYFFELKNEQGLKTYIDSNSEGQAQAPSPMEYILMGIVSCSAIDIIHILKKQKQEIIHFNAVIEGERIVVDEAKPFQRVNIKYIIEGKVDEKKAEKAATLSFEKYCSVAKTMPQIDIEFSVLIKK